MRVELQILKNEFLRILISAGFTSKKAETIADIFVSNSRDGVYSHGLNRFPSFIENIKKGLVIVHAEPSLEESFGSIERWNGNLGPGMLNAKICMNRAIELAKEKGIACVALRNTNHWMRGGTYGMQAAEQGCISISFTNTIANMPVWGGTEPRLGNNPLVIAIPRNNGHIVLDMAMSQYSYGKLGEYKLKGQDLPFDGGFDQNDELTKSPTEIIESQRILPVGLWKGAGLSLVLDVLSSVLSHGNSTAKISETGEEFGVSQVFICLYQQEISEQTISEIIAYAKTSVSEEQDALVYPGESAMKKRKENLSMGIPVDIDIWNQVLKM